MAKKKTQNNTCTAVPVRKGTVLMSFCMPSRITCERNILPGTCPWYLLTYIRKKERRRPKNNAASRHTCAVCAVCAVCCGEKRRVSYTSKYVRVMIRRFSRQRKVSISQLDLGLSISIKNRDRHAKSLIFDPANGVEVAMFSDDLDPDLDPDIHCCMV